MANDDKHNLKSLLTRALAGDAQAWNDFFTEVRKYLHAQVRRIVGTDVSGSFEHSAVVQSTLRRVWERIEDQFPNGVADETVGRFLAWAKKIVRNRSLDELKRWRREQKRKDGFPVEGLADHHDPHRTVRRDRIAAAVAAALDRLPEKDRLVIELFWLEGRSDAEISQRLGCSAEVVRVRRCRALRRLRSPTLHSLLEDSHDGQRGAGAPGGTSGQSGRGNPPESAGSGSGEESP